MGSTEFPFRQVNVGVAPRFQGTTMLRHLGDFPDPNELGEIHLLPNSSWLLDPPGPARLINITPNVIVMHSAASIFSLTPVNTLLTASTSPLLKYVGPFDPMHPVARIVNVTFLNVGGGDAIHLDGGAMPPAIVNLALCFVNAGALRLTSGILIIDRMATITPIIVDGSFELLDMRSVLSTLLADGQTGLDILPGSAVDSFLTDAWGVQSAAGDPATQRGIRVDSPDQARNAIHRSPHFALPVPLEGLSVPLTVGSPSWRFEGPGEGLAESTDRGVALWSGAAQEVELVIGTWNEIKSIAPLGIEYVEEASAEKFVLVDSITGRQQYIGNPQRGYQTGFSVESRRSSGTSVDLEFAVMLRRAMVDTVIEATITSHPDVGVKGDTTAVLKEAITLMTGDELFPVARSLDGENMDVLRIAFSVDRVGS